jgi:hypothetical protein
VGECKPYYTVANFRKFSTGFYCFFVGNDPVSKN